MSAETSWQPIATAPLDNKRPLLLAEFVGQELKALDFDGQWMSESESWEMPEVYYFWATAFGRVEEPTHWMYQPPPPV